MKRKLLSLILAAVMLCGTLSLGMTVNAANITYSDVNEGMWSYGDIMYVSDNGLMNGTGDATFSPAVDVTRSMVVTVLYRMENSPEVKFEEYAYADVESGQFYSDAVIWAKNGGIVTSTGTNEFGEDLFAPTRAITRQELATMFVRYAEYRYVITEKQADLSSFKDIGDVADWASKAMAWCNEAGLINGTGSGDTLSPKMTATREQFAAIIHRFCEADLEYQYVYNRPHLKSSFTEIQRPLVDNADVYVAIDGSDKNPGTFDKPLATFEGAVKKVREIRNGNSVPVTVAFKAGNYGYLNLELTEEDSGCAKCPITYCAYGDGEVTFSNGFEIYKDEFKPIDDSDRYLFTDKFEANIYKADLSKKTYEGGLTTVMPLYGDYYFGNNTCNYKGDVTFIAGLYDGEQSLELARFPNKRSPNGEDQYFDLGKEVIFPFDVVAETVFATRLANYHSYNNIQFIGMFAAEYESNFAAIESYNKETKTITFQNWISNGIRMNPDGFLQNISEELDFDGEYWLDVDNEVLYVYNPTSEVYTLATAGTLLKVSGAEYINFIGLNFKHSMDEGIIIEGNNITLDSSEIFGIRGSYVRDTDRGTHAVHIDGMNITIRNCELTHLGGGGINVNGGDPEYLIPSNNIIDNNLISHFGEQFQAWTAGVIIFDSVGATISHNEISHTPHQAIHFDRAYEYITGEVRAIDNIIEYNYIHDVVTHYRDAGAIYHGECQTNRGNIMRYNLISTVGVGGWGIYLDDGICNQIVYGNIFHDTGICGLMGGAGRDLYVCGNYVLKTGNTGVDTHAMSIGAKYADMLRDEGVERLWNSTWPGTYGQTMADIPTDPAALKVWQERWPELFEALDERDEITQDRITDRTLMVNSAGSTYRNNFAFGNSRLLDFTFDESVTWFNVIENNIMFTAENDPQIFVNPALGDYSIKAGADPMFEDNCFDMIGRY